MDLGSGAGAGGRTFVHDDQTLRQALDVLVIRRFAAWRSSTGRRTETRRGVLTLASGICRRSWCRGCSAAEPLVRWDWVGDHLAEIGSRLIQHLELTIVAVAIGFAISFPLAILAHRRRWTYAPVTWVAGLLYTIPSLSLFVILMPLTGLSATTVAIGLVSYTLLILIRNTAAGLAGVPADVVDSATGMGFSSRQLLWRVEVPLAMPAIMAGVRIATVSTIGLVTVGP